MIFLLNEKQFEAVGTYFHKNFGNRYKLINYNHDILCDFYESKKYLISMILYCDLLLGILERGEAKDYLVGVNYLKILESMSKESID